MASHRMSDRDRPRRPVPAWVTAPPLDEAVSGASPAPGLEARPTSGGPARPSDALAVTAVVTTAPAVTSGTPHAAPAPGGAVPAGAVVSAHRPSGAAPSAVHAVPTAIDAADGPAAPAGTVVPTGWPVASASVPTDHVPHTSAPTDHAPHTSVPTDHAPHTSVPTDHAPHASVPTDDAALAGAAPGALPAADDVVVPDFPPQQELLPPAPTSPAVQVPPTDSVPVAPGPAQDRTAAPARAATAAPVPVAVPDPRQDPAVGRPRFSVPGLEHVLVEGTEPEPTGPIGYRTPARFARQQAPLVPPPPRDQQQSAPSFEAVLAPPATGPTTAHDGGVTDRGVPYADASGAPGAPGPRHEDGLSVATMPLETIDLPETARAARPRRGRGRSGPRTGRTSAPEARSSALGVGAGTGDRTATGDHARASGHAGAGAHPDDAGRADGRAPRLPAGSATTSTDRRPAVSPTTGGLLGALTGGATLALAAWWFSAPTTVHATGIALGIVALVLSATVLRDPTTTWQRPLALLGAVLGGVGTLVLLWALAAALLGAGGVALPDVTGTGVVPGVAP